MEDPKENYVSEAENIIEEGPEREQYQLVLNAATVECLDHLLRSGQVLEEALNRVHRVRAPKLSVTHPESLESTLRNKFKPLLEMAEVSGNETAAQDVSVELTSREIGFLNEKLASNVRSSRRPMLGGSDWVTEEFLEKIDMSAKEVQDRLNDMSLNALKEKIPAFRDFSHALMKAGIKPHPDAAKMFGLED